MLEKKDLEMIAEIVKEMVRPISDDVSALREDVGTLRKDVKEVQLTLENETNRNINVIAEGHIDLNRKLDNALKIESEKELLLLRVTSLENEVRRLKAKIEEIA